MDPRSGKAKCGCVHHAEEGIACPHDIQLADEKEFNRRRNLTGTTVRYIPEKRSFSVILSNRGTELGERTDILKRGKVIQQLYTLPKIPDNL